VTDDAFQTRDELDFERRLCARVKDALMYEQPSDETFDRAERSLNEWLGLQEGVDSYEVFVARDVKEDLLAQECGSFEQYKVQAAALGVDAGGVGEQEYRARHHVKKPGSAYVEVRVVEDTGRRFRFEFTVNA